MNPPYLPLPRNIIIDVSNACNLRCKTCPQGQQLVMHPSRPMCLEDFIQLLDKLQELFPPVENAEGNTTGVKLYSWAEPLLNPEVGAMIHEVKRRGYATILSSNLMPSVSSRLTEYPLDVLIITVSGFTQGVYEHNHDGGDIEIVKSNLAGIMKSQKEKGYPKLVKVKYLVGEHNEHEVDDFRKFVTTLPGNIVFLNHSGPLRMLGRTRELGLHTMPAGVGEHVPGLCYSYRNAQGMCKKLGRDFQLVIRADGAVFPCCSIQYDDRLSLGNIFTDDPAAILTSERFLRLQNTRLTGPESICFEGWESEFVNQSGLGKVH